MRHQVQAKMKNEMLKDENKRSKISQVCQLICTFTKERGMILFPCQVSIDQTYPNLPPTADISGIFIS